MAEESKEGFMAKLLRNIPMVGTAMARGKRIEKATDRATMSPGDYTKKHGTHPDLDPELKEI